MKTPEINQEELLQMMNMKLQKLDYIVESATKTKYHIRSEGALNRCIMFLLGGYFWYWFGNILIQVSELHFGIVL